MLMRVNLYATLRSVAGTKRVDVELPDQATVGQLVAALVARFPALKDQLLDGEGKLWRHVHVMVNGRDAPYLPVGLDTPLRMADEIDVFPPVGGG
ncbi:MAG TPA: ubiquitin-like small modifier protein 1 [Chloroflexota bacterium]|jgi:MoaD family protein|nr:ubiquitin-like small modifier protein 1 [Chloroflexota bacterium]